MWLAVGKKKSIRHFRDDKVSLKIALGHALMTPFIEVADTFLRVTQETHRGLTDAHF